VVAHSKKIVVRMPPSITEYLKKNRSALTHGAMAALRRISGEADSDSEGAVLPITDQTTEYAIISRVATAIADSNTDVLSEIAQYVVPAYPVFRALTSEGEPIRQWQQVWISYHKTLDAIVSLPVFQKVVQSNDFFESKTAKYAFALFVIAYYILALGDPTFATPPPVQQQSAGALWRLVDYSAEYPDHLVVQVRNIIPDPCPQSLVGLSDPYGAYHDIVFTSALLAGIHSRVLSLPNDLILAIRNILPLAPLPEDISFEDAFYAYQRNLVADYHTFSKRIAIVSDIFSHLVTVSYAVDPNVDRKQFGNEFTFADVRLRPGTYWVHANFLTIIPDDKPEDAFGTTQRNDVVLFTDRSFIQAPALRVSKYHLFKLLADPKANRKEYFILARSRKRVKQSEKEQVLEMAGLKIPKPRPSRIEYELLSVVPISPEVVIRRMVENRYAHIVDVRDTFGLDNPSSYRDVLDSLYLLARAYAPSYAVLYKGGVVGKDQYLALIASLLSYLSPTLSVTRFDRKYDPRIHTLLYGIKGVGKTYLFEQYAYNWPHNTLMLFAGVRISEAKLLGGAMQVRVGRSSKLVFQPGEIIKADGGMIMIDELDRLARDANKRAIADAIANVMASGFAPARHVLSDSPAIDVRVHGAVLAAANPLGLKSGQYVEEMLAAMFILNDEIRDHYKQLAPEVVEELESKFFETAPTNSNLERFQKTNSGRKLIAELEYLASDTPYTFIHHDFYGDPTLHKYIDRVTFAVPMYTMVGDPPSEFLDSGRTQSGDVVVRDRMVEDGTIRISQKALLDFTQYVQTISPFTHDDDDSALQRLLKESASISSAWRKAASKTYAQKIRSALDSRETMRVFLRSLGSREAKVAYRLAHTILKLFGEDHLKQQYVRAILELINIRDSLLYTNPSGHARAPISLPEVLRRAIRDILLMGEATSSQEPIYFVRPEQIEAVYVDMLSKYVIRIPDKEDAPFDAVEYFQTVVQRAVSLLQNAGVLVRRQDDEGDILPALTGQTPEELVAKLAFKVNKQGYLHLFYDGNDLGSLGKVV